MTKTIIIIIETSFLSSLPQNANLLVEDKMEKNDEIQKF